MILIVGLGNPGDKYHETRHNIGFMVVDAIAKFYGFPAFQAKFKSHISKSILDNHPVILLKPQTFMNLSGAAVQAACQFYKPSKIITIYDDLDLGLGRLKIKLSGGHGGHNGVRDMIAHLGDNFVRVRCGIDHPGDKALVASYVLKPFGQAEWPIIDGMIQFITRHINDLISQHHDQFMNSYATQHKLHQYMLR